MTAGNVKEWRTGNTDVSRTTFNRLYDIYNVFVTTDATIYVDNSDKGIIEKWVLNATESTTVMNVSGSCFGLFIDIGNNLCCSLGQKHQVIKQSLDTGGNMSATIIAGNGSCGPSSDMLCSPHGIFVTIKSDLYVADNGNDRIQLFQSGKLIGKTLVGDMTLFSVRLIGPTGVVVDAEDNLFIVDNGNHRIIRLNSYGFYCVVGCSTVTDSAFNQLISPFIAAFDNVGNILVADKNKFQVLKFMLMINTNGN